MFAKELISNGVSPLMTSDTGLEALSLMEEFKVKHLPIVNNELLLGLISDDDIFTLNDPEAAIGNYTLSSQNPYVFDSQHLYDVIKEIAAQKLTLMPVVDKNMHYLGVVILTDLIQQLAQMSAINQPGGVIVLEIGEHDYSLGELAQIVESNDAKILSSYIYSVPNSTLLELTLKINKVNINGILQTLERYDYRIKTTIFANEDEEMDERFDSLMKYLNI